MKVKGRDPWSVIITCYNCGQKDHKAAERTSAAGERRDSGAVSVKAPRTKTCTVDGEIGMR